MFEHYNYISNKNIYKVFIRIVKNLEKIKKLYITIEKIVIIKLINCLNSFFKTYFTILNQKTRNNNKFFNL